jgi:hypothetical protein
MGGGQERFRWRTAIVNATATQRISFKQDDVSTRFGKINCQRNATLATADYDHIYGFHQGSSPWDFRLRSHKFD